MNAIEFIVVVSIVIVLIKISYVGFMLFDFFIKIPIAGADGLFVSEWLNKMGFGTLGFISTSTTPLFVLIMVFYIIFYIIYIIIITIVPETGIQTLFIPLRDLLLKIPPLPDLKKYGVFDLFDRIIKAFGLEPFLKKLLGINNALFIFSRENIKRIVLMIYPDFDTTVLDSQIDERKKQTDEKEDIKKEPKTEHNEVYDKIEENTEICISNNWKEITPDMSASDRLKVQYANINERIKCQASSIGNYIRSNY